MNLVFQFPDLQSFLWMNGHGAYVWSCYAVSFAGMGLVAYSSHLQRKRFIRQQKALAKRKAQ